MTTWRLVERLVNAGEDGMPERLSDALLMSVEIEDDADDDDAEDEC